MLIEEQLRERLLTGTWRCDFARGCGNSFTCLPLGYSASCSAQLSKPRRSTLSTKVSAGAFSARISE